MKWVLLDKCYYRFNMKDFKFGSGILSFFLNCVIVEKSIFVGNGEQKLELRVLNFLGYMWLVV